MNQQPLSETAITQSSDAPPRVNLNNKVKESISESTNMVIRPSAINITN